MKEHRKNINNAIEKIIEDFTEILAFLKIGDGSKLTEMQALVFAKRRMIDLTEQIQTIYKNLIGMKYLHATEHKDMRAVEADEGLDALFKTLR